MGLLPGERVVSGMSLGRKNSRFRGMTKEANRNKWLL